MTLGYPTSGVVFRSKVKVTQSQNAKTRWRRSSGRREFALCWVLAQSLVVSVVNCMWWIQVKRSPESSTAPDTSRTIGKWNFYLKLKRLLWRWKVSRNSLPQSQRWHYLNSNLQEITWMKTVLNDLESHNLTLTEAVNMAQNCPLWRLLAVSGAMYS